MSSKVLSLALAAVILALPLPASQLLAVGASPAPILAPIVRDANLTTLLADPFLIDALSYQKPANALELGRV
jgi:hypothetical protein